VDKNNQEVNFLCSSVFQKGVIVSQVYLIRFWMLLLDANV